MGNARTVRSYVQIEVSHDQKYMEKQLPSKRAIPEAWQEQIT